MNLYRILRELQIILCHAKVSVAKAAQYDKRYFIQPRKERA